jgi:hypothetical protein
MTYDKPQGGKTKHEHFQEMLRKARERGFRPEYVLMDSWYASLTHRLLRLVFPDPAEEQPSGESGSAGEFGRWKSHRRGGWCI